MQHSARDPLRDHVHGRIYRMTYPARPLLQPAKIAGASIDQLLENPSCPRIAPVTGRVANCEAAPPGSHGGP